MNKIEQLQQALRDADERDMVYECVEALEEIVRNDPYKQSSAGVIARAALAKLENTK